MSSTPVTQQTITDWEAEQVRRANASGKQPVAFVHGPWLLPTSWDRWAEMFEQAGFVAITPGWPDDPATVAEANAHPEVLAGKGIGDIADHASAIIAGLHRKPAVIGHSFGGLMAQIIAGRGLASVSVAIDPAPFRGVLPLPYALVKTTVPVLHNPANHHRAVPLTFEQFRYGFANAVTEDEARDLYETYAVPGTGKVVFQAASANVNPWTEAKVDTKNPNRGPLLITVGEKDHAVPYSVAHSAFKEQEGNASPTGFLEFAGRGHALIIDHGWRDVADAALAFIQKFTRV
jgi:non-heme chloroperoxidase